MNTNMMHWKDASQFAAKKLKHKFWANRLESMMEHVASIGFGKYCEVEVLRGSSEWPKKGSVSVKTEKGQKFKLSLEGKEFKVVKV